MGIYISDPAHKKEQIDAGSKEILVTDIAKSVIKADLENLLAKVNPSPAGAEFLLRYPLQYGQVKDVRLVSAAGGNQIAFVDFTTEVGVPNRTISEYILSYFAGRRTGRTCCEQPTPQRPPIGHHSRRFQHQKEVTYS